MIDAFAELTALARRAGVDADAITATHGKFFDGNVAIKESFWLAVVLPEISRGCSHGMTGQPSSP